MSGDGKILERCVELILKSSQKLVTVSSCSNSPHETLFQSHSANNQQQPEKIFTDHQNKPSVDVPPEQSVSATFISSISAPSTTISNSTALSSSLNNSSGTIVVNGTDMERSNSSSEYMHSHSTHQDDKSQQCNDSNTNTHSLHMDVTQIKNKIDVSNANESKFNNQINRGNDMNLTEIALLSESQMLYLEGALHEVAMAVSLFVEYVRKNWPLSSPGKVNANINGATSACLGVGTSSPSTPRGKRMLPMSPEKSLVMPSALVTHLRKLNTKRAIALATQGGQL